MKNFLLTQNREVVLSVIPVSLVLATVPRVGAEGVVYFPCRSMDDYQRELEKRKEGEQ